MSKPSLNCPSRNDVDLAIKQLEIDDEREKEAIRNFWARERADEARRLSLKWRVTILCCAAFFGALVLWEVFTWILDGLMSAFGR